MAKINCIKIIPLTPNQRPNAVTFIENRQTRAVSLNIELLDGVVIKKKIPAGTTNDELENQKTIEQTSIRTMPAKPAAATKRTIAKRKKPAAPQKPYAIHCCSKCGTELHRFDEFAQRLKGMPTSDVHFNFKCRNCALKTTRWQRHFEHISVKPSKAMAIKAASSAPPSDGNITAGSSSHVCTICNEHFLSYDDLKIHDSVRHVGTKFLRFVCSFCDAKFSRSIELCAHAMRAHSEPYTERFERVCCLCTEPFECQTIEELELHYIEQHTHFDDIEDERLYDCMFCSLVETTTLADAIVHRVSHQVYRCEHCPPKKAKLTTFDHWKGHTLLKHWHNKKTEYSCLICGDTFCTPRQYKQHDKAVHLNENGLYTCTVCENTYRRLCEYRRHIYDKHEHLAGSLLSTTANHMCDICGECFTSLRGVMHHRDNIHREGMLRRTYDCTICSKKFRYRNRLDRHLVTHTDSRPYKCDLCTNTYRDCSDLRRHRRLHGFGEKKIECVLCDKRFYEAKELRNHVKIHHKT